MKMFSVIVLFRCFVLCVSHANLRDNPVLKCGVEASSSLIHHNPWLVYLQYYRRDHVADIRCAGTLIDSRHIVTAAHCVKKIKYQRLAARLGEYDVSSDLDCLQGICSETVDIEISDVFIHPGYDSHRHDIAVLRLAKEAPYTDFIRPVCLPTGAVRQDVTFYAAGWGVKPSTYLYSNLKKIIPLPYCPTSQCQKAYSNLNLTDDIICAGGEEGIDTCKGDSGGPLMWIKERTELWGVTSSGNVICGTKGAPAIYTSVPEHLDWIKTVIEDL
ncbi:CLIP domain-containing serine protease HP8-like [Achroia grisella]|uniref:CLIP domain-containing serine protease HP8-like n=1 Tax=Achroia grisella TaxID=688607 RepID=UPI0027D33E29|nr:CLIP domain-containing serine protease HP8-like [Achroia grisella]